MSRLDRSRLVTTRMPSEGLLLCTGFVLLTVAPAVGQHPIFLVNRDVTAHIVRVIDGDTVDALIPPASRIRVRLHGVDSPESGEPFSQEARDFTRILMFSRNVVLSGRDVDAYGRLVARVVVDGKDASEALISAGLACTTRRFVSDSRLDTAQAAARKAGLGFWSATSGKPACVSREVVAVPHATGPTQRTSVFIGNASSRVYHLATCRNARCKNCTLKFTTRVEAEAAGLRAAKDCIRQ